AARWPKGALLSTTGSKWKTCRPWRFAFQFERCRGDFLSWFLVTIMQFRVAEFPAQAFGIRGAWHSSGRHHRRATGDKRRPNAKACLPLPAAVRFTDARYASIQCDALQGRTESR